VPLDVVLVQFKGENGASVRFADARDSARRDARWPREVGLVEHHHNGRLLLRGTFAGHYIDVDESDRVSQKGAGGGAVVGGLVGALGGPPGLAVGIVVGGIIGSHHGAPSDFEQEPELLADRLREVLPRSSSAIVLIAPAPEVDEMLAALGDGGESRLRRTLTPEQTEELEAALSSAPRVSP